MPKDKQPNELTAEIVSNNNTKIEPSGKRHSLQPDRVSNPVPTFRKTKSQNLGKMKTSKRAPPVPPIQEADNSDDEVDPASTKKISLVVVNELRTSKLSKLSRSSQRSSQSQSTFTYDNQAFEGGNLRRTGSAATSIRTSSRAPSLQSLEVVREQYCCCAKRTKCERRLLTAVLVLAIVVVVLIIVVAVIASDSDSDIIKTKLKL